MYPRSTPFSRMARGAAHALGHPVTFFAACAVILVWVLTGPFFGFSDTWQLVINTATTIVTFLMVFLIQNTQNRDNAAVQVKLDEIIRSLDGAHNALLDLEELTDREIGQIRESYERLAMHAREALRKGLKDTGTEEVDLAKTARPRKSRRQA